MKQLDIEITNINDFFNKNKLLELSIERLNEIPFDKYDFLYDQFSKKIKKTFFQNDITLFRAWVSYLTDEIVNNYSNFAIKKKFDIIEQKLINENSHLKFLDFMDMVDTRDMVYYASNYYIVLGGINESSVQHQLNEFLDDGLVIKHIMTLNKNKVYFLI